MRSFSSGLKNAALIEALKNVPSELRSHVSHLVTDKIYWRVEGSGKSYQLSSTVTLHAEQEGTESQLVFLQHNKPLYHVTLKKWPDNWVDEEIGRDKMKM